MEELKAETNGEQVHVSWSFPKTASPQYQIKIEIFNNSKCFGKPVAIHEERMPVTRHALIDVKVKNPTVRFSMTDIFDHSIEPLVIKAASATPPTQSISFPTAPGLKYELWHKEEDRHVNVIYPPSEKAEQSRNERHYWLSLDEIESGRLIQQGICNGFDLDLRGKRREGYAFRFRGLLRAPESGFYLIRMKGTDGYRIRIDQKETLLWDGLHGPED